MSTKISIFYNSPSEARSAVAIASKAEYTKKKISQNIGPAAAEPAGPGATALDNQSLKQVTSYQHIGPIITEDLHWKNYIEAIGLWESFLPGLL